MTLTITPATAFDVLKPGDKFPAVGSRFPFPFTIVRVNPVKPEFTIREFAAEQVFERVVKLSVWLHARRVHGSL